jgi:predicted nucleotidyltransferase component of viral defense system
MAGLDYTRLYELQDRVLSAVFSVEKEFYLTGGTCLSRFYQEKRYSDDLDFFAQNSPRFSFAIKNIRKSFEQEFSFVEEVAAKQFVRLRVEDLLQVDFVNDIPARYKEVVVTKDGFLIDNVENILSNKLTAVIGRDNPKDVFDIYLICMYYSFSWEKILNSAYEKASFSNEDLAIRLKEFPRELLNSIICTDGTFLDNFDLEFPGIIEEIVRTSYHAAIKGAD